MSSPTSHDSAPVFRALVCAAVALVALSGVLYGCTQDASQTAGDPTPGDPTAGPADAAAGTIRYVAAEPDTFVQPLVANGWIEDEGGPDTDSINGHAWDVWSSINRWSGQTLNGTPLPVWETWYSDADVFLDNQDVADPDSRDLDPLNQSLHAGSLRDGSSPDTTGAAQAAVLSFNRFTREILDTVHQNQYFDADALTAMDGDFDLAGTGAGGRTIVEFPNTSVMLKPVWWIVPGDEPSMLPYWAGAEDSTTSDPQVPQPSTWKQCVLIDPGTSSGDAAGLTDVDRVCNPGADGETTMAAGTYGVRSLSEDPDESDFYAFRLTQDEVDGLSEFKMMLDDTNMDGKLDQVEVGDMAVLVAMHVSTREIANWTWQTFWWSPTPQSPASFPPNAQAPPRSIEGLWAQFNMCTAYSMTTPAAEPGAPDEELVCFNPYLETDLTGLFSADGSSSTEFGRDSNCMSCHRAATFHASETTRYVASGEVAENDPLWFSDGVQTEFLWSIPFHAHQGPFEGPTSVGAPATSTTTSEPLPTTTTTTG